LVETSIVSYLRQRPSSQVVTAARQVLTHRWWSSARKDYELVISQYVLDEAAAGNPLLAEERIAALEGIPLLPNTPEVEKLAESIISLGVLPDKAQVDALHIAMVAHHEIDYLLTWNCTHIANAKILPRIYDLFAQRDVYIPVICTPEELLGEDSEDG
jgi:hypothetical protein